jgi:hypothetical protein
MESTWVGSQETLGLGHLLFLGWGDIYDMLLTKLFLLSQGPKTILHSLSIFQSSAFIPLFLCLYYLVQVVSCLFNRFKTRISAEHWWLTSVILATQEAEIRRMTV